eukprot:tig00021621_g22968.t1
MSPSQLNSRASIGPAKLVANAQAAKQGAANSQKRMTIGVQNGGVVRTLSFGHRPSSIGSLRTSNIMKGASSTKADPRPISDKAYFNGCVRNLIKYLAEHGYDHPISPKILSAPASKDFLHILQFLLRQIDPNWKFGEKFLEEIPVIFKKLRYPYAISKTALHAVGSPHTWPALLASLNWLIELLTYEEVAGGAGAPNDFDQGVDTEKVFYEYLGRAYQHFLAGEDNIDYLDAELDSIFETKNESVIEDVRKLEAHQENLRKELDALKSTPSPLYELQRKRIDQTSDIEKFKNLIASLQGHKQMCVKKKEDREAELEAREKELSELQQERTQLQAKLSAQEAIAVDLQRMTLEKGKLDADLQAAGAAKEAAERAKWALEVQVSRRLEEVNRALEGYRAAGERVKILPRGAKFADGVDFDIRLNLNAAGNTPADLVSADMKTVIKPALRRLGESFGARLRRAHEELHEARERLAVLEEQMAERREALDSQEKLARKAEERYRADKERAGEEVRRAQEEAQAVEERATRDRSDGAARLAASEKLVSDLVAQKEEAALRLAAEREQLTESVLSLVDELARHKEAVEATLAAAERRCADSLEVLRAGAVVPPLPPLS